MLTKCFCPPDIQPVSDARAPRLCVEGCIKYVRFFLLTFYVCMYVCVSRVAQSM
jgi:hypothetical protein